MLLVFATSYDGPTVRSHSVAQYLIEKTKAINVEIIQLLNENATKECLQNALINRYKVIAFYSHGNADGAVLAQNKSICIEVNNGLESSLPSFSKAALYVYACRAFSWFFSHMSLLNMGQIFGYSKDLIIPNTDNSTYWQHYENIHSYIPMQLICDKNVDDIKQGFYQICTEIFSSLDAAGASLIELMSVIQARDSIEHA